MSEGLPTFNQINLVVQDMAASLAFYRRLGLALPEQADDWPPGSGAQHVNGVTPAGMRLEFDNPAMARLWHGARRAGDSGGTVVIGFSLPSREAVDTTYGELTAAGYVGRQAPYDAFWGARYAIVQDPDGNDVGLMSPIDRSRAYTPDPA